MKQLLSFDIKEKSDAHNHPPTKGRIIKFLYTNLFKLFTRFKRQCSQASRYVYIFNIKLKRS